MQLLYKYGPELPDRASFFKSDAKLVVCQSEKIHENHQRKITIQRQGVQVGIDYCQFTGQEKVLFEFMKKNFNSEMVLFLEAFLEYRIQEDPERKKELAVGIYRNFMEAGSIHELNLSSQTRQDVTLKYQCEYGESSTRIHSISDGGSSESGESKKTSSDLFFMAYAHVFTTIENGIMFRFLRSEPFMKCMAKNPELIQQISIDKSIKSLELMHATDEIIFQSVVTDNDMLFMRAMMHDSFEWELLGSSGTKGQKNSNTLDDTLSTYMLNFIPLPYSKEYKSINPAKIVCYINAPFELCVCQLMNSKKAMEYDVHVKEVRELLRFDSKIANQRFPNSIVASNRSSSCIIQKHKSGILAHNELYACSVEYDPHPTNPSVMMVCKSCNIFNEKDDLGIDVKSITEGRMFKGLYNYYFEKVSDEVTKYISCGLMHFPKVVQPFLPTMLKKRCGYLRKGMQKTLTMVSEEDKKNPRSLLDESDTWSYLVKSALENPLKQVKRV